MRKRLAVWGWWQGHNLGDNWIKRTIADLFPQAEFVDTTQGDFSPYDFVICGGGLFIYDAIWPWSNYAQKTPYGMLGLGAEFPHSTQQAYQLSRNAEFFYVRDQYSLDCMRVGDVERSYDITFASPLEFTEKDSLDMNRLFFVWRECDVLLRYKKFPEYIGYEDNIDVYQRIIAEEFGEVTADDFQTTGNDIEERIAGCGFVISGRFHGIVAAIQKGLPCIAIDLCPKIRTLMRDCGLEEYCIKIHEIQKLGELIQRAKNEREEIRRKQWEYRQKAIAALGRQVACAKAAVDKVLRPVRVLHYGSYWMGSNDVVKVMADALPEVCDAREIDLRAYSGRPDGRIKTNIKTPNGHICILDTQRLKEDVEAFKPDAVILNSGGLVLEDSGFQLLSELGAVTVGIELSDPDVFPYNGSFYANKFDLFYTNSRYSLEREYHREKGNVHLLPFAATPRRACNLPDGAARPYDVVVVGHARADRLPVIRELRKQFKVGTYGAGWEESLGIVHGEDHAKAIASGQLYLSFAKTVSGYIKYGWYEEANEFEGEEKLRSINQSLMRGGADFVFFYTFNPPKSTRNWCNQYVSVERPGTLIHRTDYRSVPPDWLGEQFLVEAEHLKTVKPTAYAHEYLGEVTGTGGEVFDNVTLRVIPDSELRQFDRIRRGLDWGYATDPFAYNEGHYDKTRRRLYLFYEVHQVRLSNRKAAELIRPQAGSGRIVCDSAEPKSIAEVKGYGLRVAGARKGPDSVEYGVKWLQDLEEIIIDPARCPETAREFTGYELDRDKEGNFKAGFPDHDNHHIDAVRYACEDDMGGPGVRILR